MTLSFVNIFSTAECLCCYINECLEHSLVEIAAVSADGAESANKLSVCQELAKLVNQLTRCSAHINLCNKVAKGQKYFW